MSSQIPLSLTFTLSFPETSVHTTSLGYICRSHSSTPAIAQPSLHGVAGETLTQKMQVISLCKCQYNCLKGWQDLNKKEGGA